MQIEIKSQSDAVGIYSLYVSFKEEDETVKSFECGVELTRANLGNILSDITKLAIKKLKDKYSIDLNVDGITQQ